MFFRAAFFAAALLFAFLYTAPAGACEIGRPVVFAGLDWESNAFHTALARFILHHGYGCDTEVIPGSTLPLLTGMARGDIDVTMEIWIDNITVPWTEAVKKGQVMSAGTNFPDAIQGWFVPRYMIEGDAARGIEAMAPGLHAVTDLPRYKNLFRDPEEPDKGRFYNCILGWACEVVNTNKLAAYGLDKYFTNFRPGAAAALAAAITSAYKRGKPFLAYYWGPTWLLGAYDLVMLDEPPYDREAWLAFSASPKTAPPTAYPTVEVVVGVNSAFAREAPELLRFLSAYETSNQMVSEALAFMETQRGASAGDAALHFLQTRSDIWSQWVPDDVAARVRAVLPPV